MNNVWILLFALLGANPAAQPASDKIVKESFLFKGENRTYYLFVPKPFVSPNPAPLILALHGSGRDGMSVAEKWKDLAAKEGIILAAPDSLDSKYWATPADGPDFLHDLIETLKSKYPIEPRRIYLFGHSAGAVFSLSVALLESEYFAAAAVHAGAFREPQQYAVIDSAQRKIPIAIFVGTKDPYFSLEAVRATRDALKAHGFPVELTEIPGHDHVYYDLAPKINRDAWEFLRKHQLAEKPRYHPLVFLK